MQANQGVSIEALTGVLAEISTHLKRIGEVRAIQVAAGLDMSFTQLCTLIILDNDDRAPAVHELAATLGLSVAAAGRAIDVLVRENMVERREDAHDRRVKRITLAERGNALVEKLTEVQTEGLREFVGMLTDDERVDLYQVLARILARPDFKAHKVAKPK